MKRWIGRAHCSLASEMGKEWALQKRVPCPIAFRSLTKQRSLLLRQACIFYPSSVTVLSFFASAPHLCMTCTGREKRSVHVFPHCIFICLSISISRIALYNTFLARYPSKFLCLSRVHKKVGMKIAHFWYARAAMN